jgi:hypothetical protein
MACNLSTGIGPISSAGPMAPITGFLFGDGCRHSRPHPEIITGQLFHAEYQFLADGG